MSLAGTGYGETSTSQNCKNRGDLLCSIKQAVSAETSFARGLIFSSKCLSVLTAEEGSLGPDCNNVHSLIEWADVFN